MSDVESVEEIVEELPVVPEPVVEEEVVEVVETVSEPVEAVKPAKKAAKKAAKSAVKSGPVYVARKKITVKGKVYRPGDVVPEANEWTRVETWVRSGYLIFEER